MKGKIILTAIFAAIANILLAATGVGGKILNENNQSFAAVTAYLINNSNQIVLKTAITNDDGTYVFEDVVPGEYYVEARMIGYDVKKSAAFKLNMQSIKVEDLLLQPHTKALNEVAVEGRKPMIESKDGKLILNVENSSISAGNNAFEVIKRAPGVNVDKDDNISLMGKEGVNITIDGRQTYMTNEQLASFLKSTDGSQIKSIELSTTRSAKDDAEGAAGIINITMKKNRIEGFNGAFVASAAAGEFFRGNTAINLNYKRNNTTLFSNYAYTNNKTSKILNIERTIPYGNEQTFFDQKGKFTSLNKTHNYKLGIEQKTSARNTFVLQFTGNNNVEDEDIPSVTQMSNQPNQLDSIMKSNSVNHNTFNRYSFNVNNEFRIDSSGKKLTADVDYSFFKTNTAIGYQYDTFFPDMTYIYAPEIERSNSFVDIKILASKLDYTQKLWKGNIETGLKFSHVSSKNALYYDQLLSEVWENNIKRTNTFNYDEKIAAAYFDYSREINKWNIKLGLRGEYTLSDGISITESKQVKRDYFDLFPSASLSYNQSDNHVFSASYARKVSRPSYRYLNPFEYFIDKRTFERGNPYLNPEYVDGFSLNYTLFKKFNIALGHDITHDAKVESMGQDTLLKTTWVTRENLGRTNTTYLNLTIPARIGKFWTMYNNLTGIHMYFKGPIAGYYVSDGSIFFQGNSTNNFKVNKQISAELAIRYNSPFLYNVYRINGRMNTDVGFTFNFKDQRSALKLAVTDIFHSNHNNLSTKFNEFDSKIFQYDDTQTVRLTYNYKFGNLKQAVNRRDYNSEEKQRAQ